MKLVHHITDSSRRHYLFVLLCFLLSLFAIPGVEGLPRDWEDRYMESGSNDWDGDLYVYEWGDFCSDHLVAFAKKREDLDSELVSRLSSYAHLIPTFDASCESVHCPRCDSLVLPGGICNDDEDDCWSTQKCNCSNLWSHELVDLIYALGDEWEMCGDDPREAKVLECRIQEVASIEAGWRGCENLAIPVRYFKKNNKVFTSFFEQYLKYVSENPSCLCYWPHRSKAAYTINKDICNASDLDDINQENTPKELFTYTFLYSQYRQALMLFAQRAEAISPTPSDIPQQLDSIYELLHVLQKRFLDLYSTCLSKHPHPKIYYERGMVHMHLGDAASSLEDIQCVINYAEKNGQHDLLSSELYHQEGSAYADLELYDEAIVSLSKAIRKDPTNKDAYFKRAEVYFELGTFDASLDDYLQSGVSPQFANPLDPSDIYNECIALTEGLARGTGGGALEYLPNLAGSAAFVGKGLCHVLWAYGQDPLQASVDFTRAVYQCGEFIATQPMLTTIGVVFPEVKELAESWEHLNRTERVRKMGTIIGKYGVEICLDVVATKGAATAFRFTHNLIRSNNLMNFEALRINKTSMTTRAIEANQRVTTEWESILKKRQSPTQANVTRGWAVGQDINNLTKEGKIPKWNTVRQRYWKNKAALVKNNPTDPNYTEIITCFEGNLQRMEVGLSPKKFNKKTGEWESKELHHNPSQKNGGLFDFEEVWPEEHANIDPHRRIGH